MQFQTPYKISLFGLAVMYVKWGHRTHSGESGRVIGDLGEDFGWFIYNPAMVGAQDKVCCKIAECESLQAVLVWIRGAPIMNEAFLGVFLAGRHIKTCGVLMFKRHIKVPL